jgi:hypothetical protein
MNSTLQPVPLSAFGARPPASTRRRTPKSHSPCASRRSLRILPTFDLQLSTFNCLFHHQSPATIHQSLFLFSITYELPNLQLLCFDIHASDGGCRACIAVFSSNLEPPVSNLCVCHTSEKSTHNRASDEDASPERNAGFIGSQPKDLNPFSAKSFTMLRSEKCAHNRASDEDASPERSAGFIGSQPKDLNPFSAKSFTMRRSEKCAHNSFRMRSSKNTGFKVL